MTSISNHDAEVAVLSILLNNPELVEKVSLTKEQFSTRSHQVIFSILDELWKENRFPETALVIQRAIAKNKLTECGGKEYIEYLSALNFHPDNLPEFVDVLSKNYKVRELASTITSLANEVTPQNVDVLLSRVIERLQRLALASGNEGDDFSSLVSETLQEILKKVEKGGNGISTGFHSLDDSTGGYIGGDLWLIGARPGQGKSSFMCSSAASLASRGIPTLIFSKEMSRQPLIERFFSYITGIPLFSLRTGLLLPKDLDIVLSSANTIKSWPLFIDLNFTGDIRHVEKTVRKRVAEDGVKVIFLDYIQLMAERSSEQTHELGRISRQLKLLANSLNVTVVVLSQLNRETEHRDNKRPVLSDLRQSGNLEEDADCVIGLYRDEYYKKDTKFPGKIEFIILKQRNGPTGTVVLNFDSSTTKIYE